ncbi:glycosyltransferase [Cytophaga aurantiaca]|uniref:glycosyltransferase n=1 Tax=Cytophaga aurantiaca TaxID=29530 RepID=UPI00036FEF0F|nr:glycosyltransferase [Cytophaga aurantiaca]
MFLLALYPGSGDTYVSNLLKQLFKIEPVLFKDENIAQALLVKTQQHPKDLPETVLQNRKVILLVRDGRDCVANNAYFRYNTITQSTSLASNIEEAIVADKGSHFRGWSKHVEAWSDKADIIIRFEDLIENLPREMKRLSDFINVPYTDTVSLEDYIYDPVLHGDHIRSTEKSRTAEGILIPAIWQESLNAYQQALFIKYHARALVKLSYYNYEELKQLSMAEYYPAIHQKLGFNHSNTKKYKILIESSKLCMPYNDGTKRYVVELIKAIKEITRNNPVWDIQIFDSNRYVSINEFEISPYLNLVAGEKNKFSKLKTAVASQMKSVLGFALSAENYLLVGLQYKRFKAKCINNSKVFKDKAYTFLSQKMNTSGNLFDKHAVFSSKEYDLVHIPLLQHAEFILQAKEKALITIHDLTHLSHPQYHQIDNIALANYGLELSMKQNAAFFSISQSTKNDFTNRFSSDQHLDMIPEAADHTVFCPLESTYWKDTIRAEVGLKKTDEFFLSVSTLEPRKNLKNAILGFQKAIPFLPNNVYFVIVGKQGWKLKEVLPEIKNISSRIIFTGFMPEDSLPWLYREALALIYISHYEGFGLPILEAMSCKTPVIFGNNSSMIEVVGDSGYPVDSEDIDEICIAIIGVSSNKDERRKKSLQALIQSNNFHWQKTAIQTLELYKNRIETLSKL